jgi:hypothetical protein
MDNVQNCNGYVSIQSLQMYIKLFLTPRLVWPEHETSHLLLELVFYVSMEIEWNQVHYLRSEVFTEVTMKNSVFWDVMLCGSCKNRSFGGT